MKRTIVKIALSMVCHNKLGLVASLASTVQKAKGNVVSAYAIKLGASTFCICMVVSAAPDEMKVLTALVQERHPLCNMTPFTENTSMVCSNDGTMSHHHLIVYAYDDMGIVADIATSCSMQNIDISNLCAATYPAPETGIPLFVTEMDLAIPDHLALKYFSSMLETMTKARGWDATLAPMMKTMDESCIDLMPVTFPPHNGLEKIPGMQTRMLA